LGANGVERTSPSARLCEWVRKHSGGVVKGLAGIVVALAAAWYGNQLADQYADRQEERQLKVSFGHEYHPHCCRARRRCAGSGGDAARPAAMQSIVLLLDESGCGASND
jgi:hypothetical protein